MKQIIFNKINISNFKGIEQVIVDFGMTTYFKGANGTGKTSIADAVNWVLFNKDSSGASTFPVKRKDSQGNDIHNIIVDVSLDLSVNGEHHIFRRKQEENWVMKRGSTIPVLDGNVQTLYYNDSVTKTKEYADAVSSIVAEDTFRLLTSPTYFMTQIDAKKRREKLMDFVGSESEVENSLKTKAIYSSLMVEWNKDINKNKNFAQFKEYMVQKAKENKEEIERLPYQIDELTRTLVNDLDENVIKSLMFGYQAELNSLTEPKSAEKPIEVLTAESSMRDKQKELNAYKDSCQSQYFLKRSEIARARQDGEYKIDSVEAKLLLLKNNENLLSSTIRSLMNEHLRLTTLYKTVNAEQYAELNLSTVCPTCGQSIPESELQATLIAAKENWVNDHKAKIEKIIEEGTQCKVDIETQQANRSMLNAQIAEVTEELEHMKSSEETLVKVGDIFESQFINSLLVADFESEISKYKAIADTYYQATNSSAAITEMLAKRNQLQAMINDQNRRLGACESQKNTQARIDTLKASEKKLLELKNAFKDLVYLCEELEKEKNEEFERQLSSHFTRIKWRLFEQQVNGGYRQVCDALLDGKPYDAQSTGEKLFSGIDIIGTFQATYGIESPIIIDNRESLTLPVVTQSQIISMYADEAFTTLTKV